MEELLQSVDATIEDLKMVSNELMDLLSDKDVHSFVRMKLIRKFKDFREHIVADFATSVIEALAPDTIDTSAIVNKLKDDREEKSYD